MRIYIRRSLLDQRRDEVIDMYRRAEQLAKDLTRSTDLIHTTLNRSIEELRLSTRAYNVLVTAEVRTLKDLVELTEGELLRTKNCGRKTVNELKELLAKMDLSLGMKLET